MAHYTHAFLQALAATGVVAAACRAAGVSSTTVYQRKRSDADFAAMWDNAMEDAADEMEIEARRRAIDGVEEPIVHKGEFTPVWERDPITGQIIEMPYGTGAFYPKGHEKEGEEIIGHRPVQAVDSKGNPRWLTVNKKSDPMLMFLLKGARAKFSTERTELTGKDGAPLVIDSSKRAARVAAILAMAKDRQANDNSDLL